MFDRSSAWVLVSLAILQVLLTELAIRLGWLSVDGASGLVIVLISLDIGFAALLSRRPRAS